MAAASSAEECLRAGDPAQALGLLQEQVRGKPGDAKLRTFLFQLLAVLGHWDRALAQLDVVGQLDAGALAMVAMYRDAIRCEVLRKKVFSGQTSPLLFGEPEQWLALLIESLLLSGRGQQNESATLRAQAFDGAPASPGVVDDRPFEWIADADSRLGPILEAVINGRYYWVPFARLSRVAIEAPTDLRDMVWLPAHLEFSNGGETMALIPTRYPGSETSEDGAIVLARKTIWEERGADTFLGLGQRVLATDFGELSILDLRELRLAATSQAQA
jgi:type VI secretion system protein ImpE